MNYNLKHFYLQLEERNGEYEYTHRSVHELPDGQIESAQRIADLIAKEYYGSNSNNEDGGYYFFGGEIFIKVSSLQLISEEHYNITRMYL